MPYLTICFDEHNSATKISKMLSEVGGCGFLYVASHGTLSDSNAVLNRSKSSGSDKGSRIKTGGAVFQLDGPPYNKYSIRKETLIDFLPEKINEMIVQVVFGRPASCVRYYVVSLGRNCISGQWCCTSETDERVSQTVRLSVSKYLGGR